MGMTKAMIMIILGLIISTQLMYGNNKIVDKEFLKFWSDFQSAIKSNDKDKVSGYFNFPFYNENDENINLSKSQFIKYYNILIPKDVTKKNSLKNVEKNNDDIYSFEVWGNGTSDNCEYRLNITKENGQFKATSLYIRRYDFEDWVQNFEKDIVIEDFYVFFDEFKKALAKNDKDKIADMIQYPENDFSYFSYPTECITNNKDNFLKCYDRFFGKEMKKELLKAGIGNESIITKKSKFNKLNKGDAEYHISIYIGEMGYEFIFTSLNGKILLFKCEGFG